MTGASLCAGISASLATAAAAGDAKAITELFTEDATVWHNFTGRTCTADEAASLFETMVDHVCELRYADIRITPTGDGYVQQHRLLGRVGDDELDVEACIICRLDGERIARLEEYLDSAALQRAGLVLGG